MEERIIKEINALLTQLFSKMHDADYEWDAEKKELKKIKQEEDVDITDFESALFSAFSDAWQSYLQGEEVNVKQWVKEHSKELLESTKGKLKGQNSAWSEEDDKMIDAALQFAHEYGRHGLWCWLKSLKDKVQPKPQQEWSEEDERMLQNILECLKNGWKKLPTDILKYENWLKSLRPQSTWKPSKKQMKDLAFVADQNKGNMVGKTMISLYKDLTKLTE